MKYVFTCAILLTSYIAQAQSNIQSDESSAAAHMLAKTDQARQAIARNNKDEALQAVNDSLEAARKIQTQIASICAEREQVSLMPPLAAEKKRQLGAADRPSPLTNPT